MFEKIQIEEMDFARQDAIEDGEAIVNLNSREADEVSDDDLEAAAAFWDRQVSLGRALPIFPTNKC